jgi:hypothetical protein
MTHPPTNKKWSEAAVFVLAALTAFMTAYREFGAPDARQDRDIGALVDIVCLENERRAVMCQRKGLLQ